MPQRCFDRHRSSLSSFLEMTWWLDTNHLLSSMTSCHALCDVHYHHRHPSFQQKHVGSWSMSSSSSFSFLSSFEYVCCICWIGSLSFSIVWTVYRFHLACLCLLQTEQFALASPRLTLQALLSQLKSWQVLAIRHSLFIVVQASLKRDHLNLRDQSSSTLPHQPFPYDEL